MEPSGNTIEERKTEFDRLRKDIDRLPGYRAEAQGEELARLLRRMVDMLETVTLQQVVGYHESSKAFRAIGDALRGIAGLAGNKQGGGEPGQ
jgi:hypothetical protein